MNKHKHSLPKSPLRTLSFLRRALKRSRASFTLPHVAFLAVTMGCASVAKAQTYTFDGNTGTAGAQDGSGAWDTTTADW